MSHNSVLITLLKKGSLWLKRSVRTFLSILTAEQQVYNSFNFNLGA